MSSNSTLLGLTSMRLEDTKWKIYKINNTKRKHKLTGTVKESSETNMFVSTSLIAN